MTAPALVRKIADNDDNPILLTNPFPVQMGDSLSNDAFGRHRISSPETLFDSKLLYDNQPLFWDELLESGAGITSAYSSDTASVVLTSTLNTAGKFTRQTYQRFNYQPGKSQLIIMTGILRRSGGGTGVQRRIGLFDDNNGLFFEDNAGTVNIVRRTHVTGSAVDNSISQSNWNIDPMDGNGPSKITIDWSKTQIFVIDFEWLGVGRIRFGLNVNGITYPVHSINNANVLDKVYMSNPNLPIRYQIITTSSSPASTMECICSSVSSEGGVENNGILRHKDSGQLSSLTNTSAYAALGIRLKSSHIGANIQLESLSVISTTVNDQFHWELILNPTVAGTFTYSDMTNSAVQVASGSNTNTITNGTELDGGYGETAVPINSVARNAKLLGAAIDGTVDEIVLAIKPITTNISIQASITWRELS